MGHEDVARALGERMQIGKTPSRSHAVLHHAPEAFDGVEVVPTMGREAMEAPRALLVVEGRGALVRPMAPTAIDDHHHLFLGCAEGRHDLMERVAPCLGITMRHDCREDLGGAILDRAHDAAPHPIGHPPPRALRQPGWPFATLVTFDRALAPGACGQARALGFPPPARPGQGKAPEDGVIFIEPHALPLTSPGRQGGECERSPRQLSGGGSAPPGGTAGAAVLFFSHLADALAAHLPAGLAGENRGQFLTTPLGRAGPVLEGGLVDEPVEVVGQLAGHFGRATRAGAIHQALHPLVGEAVDPLAQRRRGKVQ